jgi:hypothetical protein
MGFALTILYLFTAYLGPVTVFGPLAAFHIEVIIAGVVFLVSLPKLQGSFIFKTPQSIALFGLASATFMSLLMTGWAGGAVQVFLNFIPNAFAYFLLCLHCDSKRKLKILVLMLLCVCLFVIAQGYIALQHQLASGPPVLKEGEFAPELESSYLLAQRSDAGEYFYRIRGQDFISDPNDFAQVIVCVTPLMFIFWRRKKWIRNCVYVILPVGALFYGAFLTHSRGSVLAFLAMTVVAGRRRIGTVPSIIVAVVLFLGTSALNYTGGREISADSGSGRMDLWSAGLQLLESHPIFGVGYDKMADFAGQTAHNTVVVCAAELGLFGLYFWALFLFPTLRDALAIASPVKVSEPVLVEARAGPFSQPMKKLESLDKAEANRLGRLAVLSLTGFLVAGWFLSRAFTMTLFLLGGIAEVVFEMGLVRGMIAPRLTFGPALRFAGVFMLSLLVLIYVVLRFGNLMR